MKGWHGKLRDMPLEKLDEIIERTQRSIKHKQNELTYFKKVRKIRIKAMEQNNGE